MQIGYIGLGKMGLNMALRLKEKGYDVVAYNRSEEPRLEAEKNGIKTEPTLDLLAGALSSPRLVWIMVTHQAVDTVLDELVPKLSPGDLVIDGGNSPYKESMRRGKELAAKGIRFMDVGVSGGPGGARNGACCMVGGDAKDFEEQKSLFRDLSAPDAYQYFGSHGAGHFTKMVHNGIEYGMMQALAEGFAVLKKSDFKLDLVKVANLYNHGSVIESRLVGWLRNGLKEHGEELKEISGKVNHSGEGQWTVETAKELGVPVPIIEGSLQFRKDSQNNPSYIGKILSLLRNQFGRHDVGNS